MAVKITWKMDEFLTELDRNIDIKLEKAGQMLENYSKVNCPVKTGALQASIRHETDYADKTTYVGSDLDYSVWVEAGTRKMAPRNYLKDALFDHISDLEHLFSEIQPTKPGEYPKTAKIE